MLVFKHSHVKTIYTDISCIFGKTKKSSPLPWYLSPGSLIPGSPI